MKRKGFTTIELIISMAVLVSLVVLLMPNLIGYFDNTARQEYNVAKSTIIYAAENFINNTGGYNAQNAAITLQTLANSGYISQKTIEIISKYINSGLSNAAINIKAEDTVVCVDKLNKKLTYEASNINCPI